jgi:hypothetical protein
MLSLCTTLLTADKHQFSYMEAKNGDLRLTGSWGMDSLKINLKKFDMKKFLLINRGFHWVNEYPLNK